jgi:hypothetical protein
MQIMQPARELRAGKSLETLRTSLCFTQHIRYVVMDDMIVNYRDKRTREFSEGKRIKAFAAIERRAELKLDQLESALSVRDLNRKDRQRSVDANRPIG